MYDKLNYFIKVCQFTCIIISRMNIDIK